MRPALKPGLLPVWRDRDTLQIGIDSRRAVALTGMAGLAWVVSLLDGSRDRAQVIQAATDHGVPEETAERILALLATAGALDDFPAGTLRLLSPPLRARLAAELATVSLAHRDGDGGARTLARRLAAQIQIYGGGRVGAAIADLLTTSGIGRVTRVGAAGEPPTVPEEAQPGQAQSSPAQTGQAQNRPARAEAARRAVTRGPGDGAAGRTQRSGTARPSHTVRPGQATRPTPTTRRSTPTTRRSTPTTRRSTPATRRSTPATRRSTPATRRSTPATRPAPATQPTPATQPDLAVLASRHPLELRADLMRDQIPHLAVLADEAIGIVGPLVIPGRTACLRCLDLTRTDRDPAWPLILAQLVGREPDPRACDAPLAAAVAAQAATQVLAFIDRAVAVEAVTDGTLELVLPEWQWRRRTWPRHRDCSCGSHSSR